MEEAHGIHMTRAITLTVGIWTTAAAIAFVNTTCLAMEFGHTHTLYDDVLKARVTDGRVDYNALKVNLSYDWSLNDKLEMKP